MTASDNFPAAAVAAPNTDFFSPVTSSSHHGSVGPPTDSSPRSERKLFFAAATGQSLISVRVRIRVRASARVRIDQYLLGKNPWQRPVCLFFSSREGWDAG